MSEQAAETAPEVTREQMWGLDPVEAEAEPEAGPEVEESETEVEESDTEAEEEGDGEEAGDVSESDEGEEAEEEEVNPLAAVNENLNKALKAERDKRKTAIADVKKLEKELSLASGTAEAEAELDRIIAQITELDLLDTIKVNIPKKRDPELQKLLDTQEQGREMERVRGVVTSMQEEVSLRIGEFTDVDVTSVEQGEVLGRLILTSVETGGMEMEEAVEQALTTLNTLLKTKVDSFKSKRQPKVKPSKKTKTAARVKPSTSKHKKFDSGDVDGFFKDLGGTLFDS